MDVHKLERQTRALLEMRRPERALGHADQLVLAAPDRFIGHILRGRALFMLGRHQECVAACDKATAVAPDREWAFRLRAIALVALGRKKEALDSAKIAVGLAPEGAAAHAVQGWCFKQLGQLKKARVGLERALELDPDDSETLRWMGDTWLESKPAEAALWYERALAADPEDGQTLNNYGASLARRKKWLEAGEVYVRAARVRPDLEITRGNIRGVVDAWCGLYWDRYMLSLFALGFVVALPFLIGLAVATPLASGLLAWGLYHLWKKSVEGLRRKRAMPALRRSHPELVALYEAVGG